MRRILLVLALVTGLGHGAQAAGKPLKVVASFSIIADFARNVGGDHIALTTLVGPDSDIHVYAPSPADAAALARADVVLVNGLGLEGFLARLFRASAAKAVLVEVSRGASLVRTQGQAPHGGDGAAAGHDRHGIADPHAWQSVANAKIYVANIARAFCAADADGCTAYTANAQDYLRRLDALDREIRSALALIPRDRRVVISAHDAFAYLGHAYGIRFLAPEGITTQADASAAGVASLIRQIRASRASALFVENISDPRLIKQIASETGIAVVGQLYSDALSKPAGPAPSYIAMMGYNARTITQAILGR